MGGPQRFLLSRGAVRELDRLCIEEYGIPGVVLMENAGRGAAEHLLRACEGGAQRVVFLCGPGNNAGDAYVAARHLHNAGVEVELHSVVAAGLLRGDAAWARAVVDRMGLDVRTTEPGTRTNPWAARLDGGAVLVDGLLGTGAIGAPRGVVAEVLRACETSRPRLRVALDLPSGLDADTGEAHEPCFTADLTLTFAALKPGLSNARCGRIEVIDIGAPRELLQRLAGT